MLDNVVGAQLHYEIMVALAKSFQITVYNDTGHQAVSCPPTILADQGIERLESKPAEAQHDVEHCNDTLAPARAIADLDLRARGH